MKEATRTLIYAVTAAVAVGGASLTHYWTKPVVTDGFELVGQDFFPDFEDPTLAKSLRVVAYDEDTASVSEFEVQQDESGHWTIPSRNDYPADGEDRLAKTAASIIGIKRGALASRYEADYEKYGVIEPDATDEQKLKGRGQRITLEDGDGNKLVDYIIGKNVDNPDGHYYVRVPGEKETYISKFDVDLSTRFTDWIEDDLLKVDQSDLTEIRVDNYSIDEQQGAILGAETNILKKDGADWKLDGLNDETEELKTDEINTMISTLDNLKIVGVRAKPEGLNADLTVSAKAQVDVNRLAAEMASRGFVVARKRDGDGAQIYANEGEVTASTSEGIAYTLRFGEIFTGSQSEIEGLSGPAKTPKKQPKETKPDDPANADKSDADAGESDPDADDQSTTGTDSKSSRYVFISAAFDERLLGDKPVRPTEPPTFDAEASDAPANDKNDTDAKAADDDAKKETDDDDTKKNEGDDAKKETDDDDTKKDEGDDTKTEDSGDAKKEEADDEKQEESADTKKEEDDVAKDENAEDKDKQEDDEAGEQDDKKDEDTEAAAREAYDAQLRKYESDLKAFDKKVEDGKELAKKLNDRFAKWYYVISAESFEKLRLSRDALVKPKEKTDEETEDETSKDETGKDETGKEESSKDETGKNETGKDKPGKDAVGKDEPIKDGGAKDKTQETKAESDKDGTKKSDADPPKPADSKNDAPKSDEKDAGADKSKTAGDDESKEGESGEATEKPEPKTDDNAESEPTKESPGEEESGESNADKKPAESGTDPPAPKP